MGAITRFLLLLCSLPRFLRQFAGLDPTCPGPDKETIVLVHGPYAAPKAGVTQWYQPGSTFCRRLDAAMERNSSEARCWRHLKRGESVYSWDGENNWHSRLLASKALAREVSRLAGLGWRCYVVSHGHGGNVALEAHRLFGMNRFDGLFVLMGCPVISYKDRALRFTSAALAFLTALAFLYFFPGDARSTWDAIRAHDALTTALIAFVIACLVTGVVVNWAVQLCAMAREDSGESWDRPEYPCVFHFYHPNDEALTLLKALAEMENPFRAEAIRRKASYWVTLQAAYRADAATYGRGLFDALFWPFWMMYAGAIGAAFDANVTEWLHDHTSLIYLMFVYSSIGNSSIGMLIDLRLPVSAILLPYRAMAILFEATKSVVVALAAPWSMQLSWNRIVSLTIGIVGSHLSVREVSIGVEYLHVWPDGSRYKGDEACLCTIEVPASLLSSSSEKRDPIVAIPGICRHGHQPMVDRGALKDILEELEVGPAHSVYYTEPRIAEAIGAVLAAGPNGQGLAAEDASSIEGNLAFYEELSYRSEINSYLERRCGWPKSA